MKGALVQTSALFLDAYRELNARKLFWISLALSAIVVLSFAAIGLTPKGYTLLWWEFPNAALNSRVFEPQLIYKYAFVAFAIPIWLAWGATILGLISTASIVPEFIAGGAIELTLSKPIGRLCLILTKYATALLFMAMQVSVFTIAAFLVIGIRGKSWEPRLFLAIPIMIGFFSYLYSICMLLGMLTRSTIASLLLTLLIWMGLAGINGAEEGLLVAQEYHVLSIQRQEGKVESYKAQIQKNEEALARAEPESKEHKNLELGMEVLQKETADKQKELDATRHTESWLRTSHTVAFGVKSVLPKTKETVRLLERSLLQPGDLDRFQPSEDGPAINAGNDVSNRKLAKRVQEVLRGRSVAWVVGTSLAFEGVVLALGAWLFVRRDF